jgi:hypothetical protein
MTDLKILRLPNNGYDKNKVEVYIPPAKAPDNWPPDQKPEPATPTLPQKSGQTKAEL